MGPAVGGAMDRLPVRSALVSHSFDTTFEAHYTIGELARQWKLGRETVRLLIKDEPDVLKIRLGRRKALTRYSIPESVARRVHTRLFNPAA
jgi:hypothetical protein